MTTNLGLTDPIEDNQYTFLHSQLIPASVNYLAHPLACLIPLVVPPLHHLSWHRTKFKFSLDPLRLVTAARASQRPDTAST